MSHPAKERAAQVPSTDIKEESTGRFSIEEIRRGADTVLPPRGDEADLVSLEDVGAVELEADEQGEAVPTSPLPRGIVSGVFSAGTHVSAPPPIPAAAREALPAPLDPAQEVRRSERARLEIQDFSLLPDNPYAASSLVPPPRKPMSAAKAVGIAAVALAVAGSGWFVVRQLTTPDAAPTREPQVERAAPAAAPKPAARVASERPASRESALAPAAPMQTAPSQTQARNHAAASPTAATGTTAPSPTARATEAPKATVQRAEPAAVDAPAAAAPVASSSEPAAPPEPVAPAATPSADQASAAVPAATATPEEAAAALAALPVTPTREQVVAGFDAIVPELVRCAAGKHGIAQLSATIAGSGRVSYALVDGQFQGSPEGSCMVRAVRTARFPQFTQPTLKVSYPVSL